MKKVLLLYVAIFAVNSAYKAQNDTILPQTNDTLRYFTYKQLYKLPLMTTTLQGHPYFKSKATVITNTFITHVGSIFKNKDPNLMVYGLESRVLIPNTVATPSSLGGVPYRMYLCNVVNGFPVLPALDSIFTKVVAAPNGSNSAGAYFPHVGAYAGGTFTNGPKSVTGDFAVLARCVSGQDGDTVLIFRTAGRTATATNAPSPAHKFGEGLGVVRNGGVFYKTTNYNDPQFGPGTDYEFCVAPMVTFTLHVSQIESATQEGACECEVFTNTNTSSPEFTNRQFNFNEFYRELKPFDPQSAIMNNFTPDSVLAWNMGDGSPLYYLPPGIDSIHLAFASGICNQFFFGDVTGKYKQSAYKINAQTLTAVLDFSASCVWCIDTAASRKYPGDAIDHSGKPASPCTWTAINEQVKLQALKIYPNPTTDKTMISGLEGTNNIYIYNMMGQLLSFETTTEKTYLLDLSKRPQGSYLIRINNSENNTRFVKIVRD